MADTQARLMTLLAEEDVRQLARRYATAVDRRDATELRRLFAPGSFVTLPDALAGPGGPTVHDAAELLEPLTRFTTTRHTLAQHLVEAAGDTATGEAYGEAHHVYERDGRLRDHVLALRYVDAYVRTDDGWRFASRELRVDWITDVPVTTLRDDLS